MYFGKVVAFLCLIWPMALCWNDCSRGDINAIRNVLSNIVVGRKVAHIVRAVFHDCVGGCNGCLNLDRPQNQGTPGTSFIETVQQLDQLYDTRFSSSCLSRADFYVLAAEVGLENAVEKANMNSAGKGGGWGKGNGLGKGNGWGKGGQGNGRIRLNLDFRYGRTDCPTSPVTDVVQTDPGLPSGHLNMSGVFDFYSRAFGMNEREATAINFGGHTLGGATGASGWIGFWSGTEAKGNEFNNVPLQFLADRSLTWRNVIPVGAMDRGNRWQWEAFSSSGEKVAFALNSDMSFFRDITTDDTGRSACTFDSCAESAGTRIVKQFAQCNQLFVKSFESAWKKMVSTGSDRLRRPTGRPF